MLRVTFDPPVAFLENDATSVSVRVSCLVTDASGMPVDATAVIGAPTDASVLGDGRYAFVMEPGSHIFTCSCQGLSTRAEFTVSMDDLVDEAADSLEALNRSSEIIARGHRAMESGDATAMLEAADELSQQADKLERLLDVPWNSLRLPYPYGGPTEQRCNDAGYPLNSDDAAIPGLMELIEQDASTVSEIQEAIDASGPSQQLLDRYRTAIDALNSHISRIKALSPSPCGVYFHQGDLDAAVLDFLLPVALEAMHWTAATLRSQASGGRKFSMAELSFTMSYSEFLNTTISNMYGPMIHWIAQTSATLALANLIDALWVPSGGPEVIEEGAHGGAEDVCPGYTRFLVDKVPVHPVSGMADTSGMVFFIVTNAHVAAIEGIVDAVDGCDDADCAEGDYSCTAQAMFDCMKGIYEAFQNANTTISNSAQTLVFEGTLQEYDGYAEGLFSFNNPYSPESPIGIDRFIVFPWHLSSGRGPRWDGNLYNCQ